MLHVNEAFTGADYITFRLFDDKTHTTNDPKPNRGIQCQIRASDTMSEQTNQYCVSCGRTNSATVKNCSPEVL